MQSILIISFSNIERDPRIMRQVRLLEPYYQLTIAGFGDKPDANIEFIALGRRPASLLQKAIRATKLFLGAYESYYWNIYHVGHAEQFLSGRSFDLVLANDISALPLALSIAADHPVLVDAHEYSPREFEDKWWWRLLFGRYHHYLCKKYLPQVAAMTTVCQGIADEYHRVYGVSCRVVHNAPYRQELSPSPVEAQRICLIHHGATIRSRHLELMITMMKYLDDRFTLDFMLVDNDSRYMAELRALALADQRIRFVEPVPMPEISSKINKYDVGIFLIPPVNFNYKHALPNKFFEFIQARLAVAIGPSPEMARLVKQYNCGVVADSFAPQVLAGAIQALNVDAVKQYKAAADTAAEDLCFEASAQVVLDEIQALLSATAGRHG